MTPQVKSVRSGLSQNIRLHLELAETISKLLQHQVVNARQSLCLEVQRSTKLCPDVQTWLA